MALRSEFEFTLRRVVCENRSRSIAHAADMRKDVVALAG